MWSTALALSWVAACGLSGCGQAQGGAEARGSATASAAAAQSIPTPEPDPELEARTLEFARYRDVEGVFFPAGKSAVVCGSPCVFPRPPGHKMWLVEDGVAREAPELWPERANAAELRSGGGWARNVAYMQRKGLVDTVHFSGEYPGALFAQALEPCQVQDGAQREVQFHADGWKEPSSWPERVRLKPRPPRALYPALASGPVSDDPRRTLVYGADSPPMVAEEERLCVYDDVGWQCSDAPWGSGVSLWRLADGRTLALSGDAYLIEPDGAIYRVEVEAPHFTTVVDMGGVVWLAGRGRLSKPVHPERFRLFDADAWKYEARRPPVISVVIPEGDELTQDCATPAVVMQRKDGMPPRLDEVLRRARPSHQPKFSIFRVAYRSGERIIAQAEYSAAARVLIDRLRHDEEYFGDLKCLDLESLFQAVLRKCTAWNGCL